MTPMTDLELAREVMSMHDIDPHGGIAHIEQLAAAVIDLHGQIDALTKSLREVCGIAKDWTSGRSGKVHARIDELWERATGTPWPSGPMIDPTLGRP